MVAAGGGPVRAFVPFAFEVDGVVLPSGQYVVEPGSGGAIVLRPEGGRALALEVAVDRYAAGCSCLRFHHYADGRYVLSDVHAGGRAAPLEVVSAMRKSRREYPMEAVEVPVRKGD
jgi:hypothetical protein